MKVTIHDYTVNVGNNLTQKASIFIRLMADYIQEVADPNTPKRTGLLRKNVLKQTLGLKGKIMWNQDYAAKMEEVQFKNYTTPGTNKDFAKNAVHEGVQNTDKILKNSGLI